MLSQTIFTEADATRLEAFYKRFRRIMIIVFALGLVFQVLCGLISSYKHPTTFWRFSVIGILVVLALMYLMYTKILKVLKRDLTEQTKLVGEVTVLSRKEKQKQFLLITDSSDIKDLAVSKDAFEKIAIGDVLTVEISSQAKFVFAISKDGELIK